MIYKVTYQESTVNPPRRETTQSLYIEADSVKEVRQLIADNTEYGVEYIQALDPAHLAYEQKDPNFKLTEFDNQ